MKKMIITLVFKKNVNFFAENWEKLLKIVIVTSSPVSWQLQKLPTFFGHSFPQLRLRINFGTKNGLGYNLGEFFTNSSGHPALHQRLGVERKKSFHLKAIFQPCFQVLYQRFHL
jgi:hypothetical protein